MAARRSGHAPDAVRLPGPDGMPARRAGKCEYCYFFDKRRYAAYCIGNSRTDSAAYRIRSRGTAP